MTDPHKLERWPLLLGATLLLTAGLALDLADSAAAPFAAACLALGAVAFGAFVYAEGARHRDWTDAHRPQDFLSDPRPARPETGNLAVDTPRLDPGGVDPPTMRDT